VTSLVVDGGSGSNIFTVSGTAANTPLTLNTGPFGSSGSNDVYIDGSSSAVSVQSAGNDNVYVGSANHSLASIGGPVNVSNWSGQDRLEIDDSSDSARSINITSNAVEFAATGSEPAVTINYSPAQTNSSNGQMVGVNQLEIDDAHAANQIEVDSVGPNTTTSIYGDTQDTLTGPAAGQVQMYREWS
jgi:hypothetical protein